MSGFSLVLLVAAGVAPSVVLASPLYLLTPITSPDGANTFGYGVNDLGQVAGVVNEPNNLYRPFVYTPGIGFSYLDAAPGATNARANAINDAGQVVVSSDGRAFVYTPGSGFLDIGTLGAVDTAGLSINDEGAVTGVSRTLAGSSDGLYHAFLYSTASGIQDLGSLGDNSVGQGINNLNQVTGYYVITGTSYTHAFVDTPGQGMVDITPDAKYAEGYSINDSGQVTGTADGYIFIYTPGEAIQYLPFGAGTGINAAGQVVGGSSETRLGFAFIYNEGASAPLNLNALIEPSTFLLQNAGGISNNGRIVANADTFLPGQSDTYLLTPNPAAVPEPASAALLAWGALALFLLGRLYNFSK